MYKTYVCVNRSEFRELHADVSFSAYIYIAYICVRFYTYVCMYNYAYVRMCALKRDHIYMLNL